ncbi:hypothetical protein G7Y89_g14959 [Cudoniella acicularis]|uniref:Uncharacterized protein n=1 Tax=Cudoniella acicularis TaxID=354080 RepID=A0A8H4VPG4_9HELO|nr:hypothetical protein G7Y89_g14959 [Cudoniella acicularis]
MKHNQYRLPVRNEADSKKQGGSGTSCSFPISKSSAGSANSDDPCQPGKGGEAENGRKQSCDGCKEKRSKDAQSSVLQFVMVNKPQYPANHSYRKAVRSHVMRSVHSARREKNNLLARRFKLLSKDCEKITNTGVPGSLDSNTSYSGGDSRFRSDAAQLPLENERRAESFIRSHNITKMPQNAGEVNRHPFEIPGINFLDVNNTQMIRLLPRTPTSKPNSNPYFEDPYPSTSYFDRWRFNTTTPYALLQIQGAPPLCMNARNWPFPQPLGGTGPHISVWMPGRPIPVPNFRAPRPCLHKSVQVLPFIGNCPEYFAFKGETIKWINSRLSNLEEGTSDVTIGSILLLLSFETGRGNTQESVFHIDGLQRIVTLRGGIESFTHDRPLLLKILL